jgi:capsular polysaccharide transport system permease protein
MNEAMQHVTPPREIESRDLDTSLRVSDPAPAKQGVRQIVARAIGRLNKRAAADVAPLRLGFNGYLWSFIFLVIIPAFISTVYLAFIASDQYVAEARFAVRGLPSDRSFDKTLAGLSTAIGSTPSIADQNAYIVTSYIRSRAIVDDLSKSIDLRAIFARPEADFWARLKSGVTIDDLVRYWNAMVETYVDAPSGIVTVAVRAFRANDAVLLSKAVLAASERLVNEVSERARADAMRDAEAEVRRYEAQVRDALLELRKLRDREGFISPANEATSTSTLLLQLMGEKIKLQNELFVASRTMTSGAPTVKNLRAGLDALDKQIEGLKSQLTGNSPEGRTISKSIAQFEELELKRIFAEKLYTMAQDSLERARLRAERQNLYVSVFVQPMLPEDAEYPKRLALSLIISAGLLIVWGILALIAAAIEDHRI